MKKELKKYAVIVAGIIGGGLTYVGSLVTFSCLLNGDERSMVLAIFPALLVAGLISEKDKH